MSSFDLILPLLPTAVGELILDPTISDLMIQDGQAFVDREGLLSKVPGVSVSSDSLRAAIESIARQLGDDVGRHSPILDSRLPDGSRVAAVLPPCAANGVTLTIRKFGRHFTALDLILMGAISGDDLEIISNAIENRTNVLVSGSTGAGKTTLVNALVGLIPPEERLIVIEKPAELKIFHANVVRWEAVDELPGRPAVTVAHLLRAALRHRPDRIIIGEVRDRTAYDMLQAMNTGHSGTLSTIHADSAEKALYRLASLAMPGYGDLGLSRQETAAAIQLVVHIERRKDGKRRVREVIQVNGYDAERQRFEVKSVGLSE